MHSNNWRHALLRKIPGSSIWEFRLPLQRRK